MVIRNEQFHAFELKGQSDFEARASAELRSSHAKQLRNTSDEQLREEVRGGQQRAAHYGITDENWVIQFLGFLVEYGQDFGVTSATAWAAKILERSDLDEQEKITRLRRRHLSARL